MLGRSIRIQGPLAVVLFLGMAATAAWGGTTGKLAGRILDDKKQPLAGVNVRIEGLRLGAVSDENGRYFVIAIPAGTYVVRVQLLGYAAFTASNVAIAPDFTTDLDVTLRTEAVQMGEVRVEAVRPLLQKDATGTTRFISSDEIQKLPTRGYRDAAAQQSGVVNFLRQIDNEAQNQNTLIVRGGRPNEVAYFVDGFSQQDPLTGTSSTSISNNAIEEVVLLTGGFAPEYGRIMSGAVNVVTREGGSKYSGAIEAVSDALAGDWVRSARTDYNVYDISLGGPVLPKRDNLTFYVSGERRWQRDRSPSAFGTRFSDALESLGLDNRVKPNNSSSGYTYQGKLSWQANDGITVKAGGLGSFDEWRQYVHSYLFNLPHAPRYEDQNHSWFATMNHVLSPQTFYNLGLNFFLTERKRGDGVAFDDLSPKYQNVGRDTLRGVGGQDSLIRDIILSRNGNLVTPGGYYREPNPRFDGDLPLFFTTGHVFDDYLQRKSSYYGVQGSMTSQVNRHNQLKFGGDVQLHSLRFFNHLFPVELGGRAPNIRDYDAYGYDLEVGYKNVLVMNVKNGETTYTSRRVADRVQLVERDDGRDGLKHPKSVSFFAQDKFEREGLIVNGGLRFDYIKTDTPALKSDQLPLGDPDDPTNRPDSLETQELVGSRSHIRVSPRLGIAFPLDEKSILRFNYGQFYQQPNLQDLYVSYRFLQHKVKTGGYFVGFGNPNLRPERTTAYEVGFARQLGDNLKLDLTAYYKDVKDLVEITTIASFPNSFSSYRNRDFATVKGIDLGFTMRPINHFSGNAAYSLSYAQGTGSVSQTQRNVAWTATQPPKHTSPLDFDQRHKLSLNLDFRLRKGEGPIWGNLRPFENAGVNLLFNVGSGTPFTPTDVYNEITLASVSSNPSGSINSRYGPWATSLDLKASRSFGLRRFDLEAFAWVLNVFDNRNPVIVYSSTGSANSTSWLNTSPGQAFLDTAAQKGADGNSVYRLAENDPGLFSNPRLVRFGLRASF